MRPEIEIQQSSPEIYERLERVENLSNFLDRSVTIPNTSITLGADALIGLIPVIGDALGGMISAFIIYQAALSGVPRLTLVKMLGNILLDVILGSIPVLGDVFDIAWKANVRNSALFRKAVNNKKLSALNPDEAAARIRFAFLMGGAAIAITVAFALIGLFLLLKSVF